MLRVALHRWLFRPRYSVGFGSRKLELVDRLGDPDSIFEKIRFLLYRLPEWMLPDGFDHREHDNHASADQPGHGGDNHRGGRRRDRPRGRKSAYFIDEAAFLERPESVDRGCRRPQTSVLTFQRRTAKGNPFFTKRHLGKTPVFTFHWRDDPRKGEAWMRIRVAVAIL